MFPDYNPVFKYYCQIEIFVDSCICISVDTEIF